MNTHQAERRLLNLFSRKPSMQQPGRLLDHLANELGANNSSRAKEMDIIADALVNLERKGVISISRSGKNLNGVEYIGHVDRTDRTPQQKREDCFARGVPAFLPDALCSPVVISYQNGSLPLQIAHDDSAVKVMTTQASISLPYEQTLSKCLIALREAANSQGVGHSLSVLRVLMCSLDMSKLEAQRAMEYLQGMGLYITEKTGFHQSSYTVDLEVPEVTSQMMTSYRTGRRKPTEEKHATPDQTSSLPDTLEASAIVPTSGSTDPLEELMGVVEAQEAALGQLASERNALQEERDALLHRLDVKQAELAEALQELTELKRARELANQRAQSILSRYKR